MDEVKWNLIVNLNFGRLIGTLNEFKETRNIIPIKEIYKFNKLRNNVVHQSFFDDEGFDREEIDNHITLGLKIVHKLIKSFPSYLKGFA